MGDNKGTIFLFGGLAAFIILVVYLISSAAPGSQLDRSAIGTKGLVSWLRANDVQVIEAHRRVQLSEQDVDLRLLPLYDVDITRTQAPAISRQEQLRQSTQRDISGFVLDEKLSYVETLVLLPKWRTGTIMLGLADKQLLIPMEEVSTLLAQLELGEQKLIRPDVKFLETRTDTGFSVTLYRPQLFDPLQVRGNCAPLVTVAEGDLVINCTGPTGMDQVYLSDPDLLNNHGLALGQNSAFALDLVERLRASGDGVVYYDTSDDLLLSWQETRDVEQRPRSTEDVSRFFTYPFTLIWLSVAAVFLIAAWRGFVRFGPPIQAFKDQIGASKTASIAAKAYLLRLTGQDHALLAEYADNRLNDLSRDLYGKNIGKDRAALFNRLTKIAPKSAGNLMDATNRMISTTAETSPAELSKIMQQFDLSYRSISDELGRISRTR
ncbi:hypothetical protein SAMN04488515_0063 [Cognatiyoonia koreensis]|uniref:DUF4350 domain-containing protein n=1 Tax=Cognatiyoonia koreensis TaxID=364200 RepID=A0A1I0ML51_9RHOB|nr:hypothetical protein [Cognatiyoonia koreensis]SEV88606.1 hypothetical protein SAMN04488515_0063 [Cognatiyoonia koreensis]